MKKICHSIKWSCNAANMQLIIAEYDWKMHIYIFILDEVFRFIGDLSMAIWALLWGDAMESCCFTGHRKIPEAERSTVQKRLHQMVKALPVSYTHLTLPTIYSV